MENDWNDVKKILCLRLDNMGDVLMSSPAIRALKGADSSRHITLLTSSMGSKIAEFIPEIDEVIEFNVPWIRVDSIQNSPAIYDIAYKLKQKQFDGAIIFTTFSQNPYATALLCYLAGIPNVLSYCRENPYALISNWVPDLVPLYRMQHQVERDLALVKIIGAETSDTSIKITITTEAIEKIQHTLKKHKIDTNKPIVAIHPGVSEVKRQYPPEKFADIAKKLVAKGFQVIITGSKEEADIAKLILKKVKSGITDFTGKCTLEEFIAVISEVDVLISNNTGPVHIAAAVQTPVVVFYARTNPEHTPWNVRHNIFYFDVPQELQSNNVILTYALDTYMNEKYAIPTTEEVISAVSSLIL